MVWGTKPRLLNPCGGKKIGLEPEPLLGGRAGGRSEAKELHSKYLKGKESWRRSP
jgi:hypothetical protein